MGNTWMSKLKLKQKKYRMRRAYLKSYSYRRGDSPVPSPVYRNDQGDAIEVISFRERNKAAKTIIPHHIEARFRDHNPESQISKTIERSPKASKEIMLDRVDEILSKMVQGNPRTVVLKKLVQNSRQTGVGQIQGVAELSCLKLLDGKWEKVYLYFTGEINILVRQEIKANSIITQRSIIYRERQRAKDAWLDNRVAWVERQERPRNPEQPDHPPSTG